MNRITPLIALVSYFTGMLSAQQPKTIYVAIRVDDIFMSQTNIQPQEIDSLITMLNRHGAKLQLAVIPHRLIEPQNADGKMKNDLKRFLKQGHMISLHGWNHRHQPTGNTGQEFQDSKSGEWVPYDSIEIQLRRGKVLLEEIAGKPVATYVSPGNDDQLHPINLKALHALNMRWVTAPKIIEPLWADSINSIPDMPEYTWAIDSSAYSAMLDSAKTDFTKSISNSRYYSFCMHDHFTRYAWHNGILIRWVDEFLTWIEHRPGMRVKFVTIEDLKPEYFGTR
ncbi:MAG: DUF2334 domain-containing protein [Ignavibacteriales bacterium]|nr:DUF2334 domain-containing protein [Ignavibacteriales bacterium]